MTHPSIPSQAPYGTVLWAFIQLHLEAWLIYRKGFKFVPRYVVEAFKKFLECGDPVRGFVVLECPNQHTSRYVVYRCKGRGFCVRCILIRQRELGAQLIRRIIGNVPVRHLVLCFPPAFRFILGYDKELLNAGFRALSVAMFNHQRHAAMREFGVPWDRIHPGCVEVAHRASGTLVTNHHVHGIFPNGVFIERDGGSLEFAKLPRPSDADIAAIAHEACVSFCTALKRRGFWETTATSPDGVEGVLSLPGTRPHRLKFFGQAAKDGEGGVAPVNGAYAFHLYIGNAIEVEDRPQLQHLVDYILAPPFLDNQTAVNDEGNFVLKLKRTRRDKATEVELEPNDALDRLAELIPRPRANAVRYYGVYAPRARLRKQAIALRIGDPGPARVTNGPRLCPICGEALRVIHKVIRPDTVPPDTPVTSTPRGQDRIERRTSNEGQGRLFS